MASPVASADVAGSASHPITSSLPGPVPPTANHDFVPELNDDDDDVFLATPQDPNLQRTMGLQLPCIQSTPNIRDPVAEKRNSAATRERAATAAPAGTRCVLTQEPNEKGGTVQAAHAIPRSWQKSLPERIRSLEYHLGFPKAKTLNLDTRWNIMFLLVIYHLFYDHGVFIFVPSMEIIDAIYQFTIENLRLGAAKKDLVFFLTAFKTPPEGWQYDTLPVKMSAYHSIFRKTLHKVDRNGKTEYEDTAKYRRFKYPFHTLPLVHIHVNPCLMIISAWHTINKLPPVSVWTPEQLVITQKIRRIVNFWLGPAPDDFQTDPSVDRPMADPGEVHGDEDHHEDTSDVPLGAQTDRPANDALNAVAGPSTLPYTRGETTNTENAAAPSSQSATQESSNTENPQRSKRKLLVASDGNDGNTVTHASKRARNR